MRLIEWLRSLLARNAPEPPRSGGAGATGTWDVYDRRKLPLGLRQRNPLNVRPSRVGGTWRGQIGVENGFAVFETYHAGIRAGALNLRNYQRKHGLRTIAAIVPRYAPAADNNNVEAYMRSLEFQTGWKRTDILDLQDRQTLARLVKAVIKHEQGIMPFPSEEIMAAVDDALRAA